MTRTRSKVAATHPPMMACILDLSFSVGIAVVIGVVTVVVSAKRICTLDILAFMELESSTSDPCTMLARTSFFITGTDDPGGNCT